MQHVAYMEAAAAAAIAVTILLLLLLRLLLLQDFHHTHLVIKNQVCSRARLHKRSVRDGKTL